MSASGHSTRADLPGDPLARGAPLYDRPLRCDAYFIARHPGMKFIKSRSLSEREYRYAHWRARCSGIARRVCLQTSHGLDWVTISREGVS